MASQTFDTAEKASVFLLNGHAADDSSLAQIIVQEIVSFLESSPAPPASNKIQVGKFVIRADDVDIFDAVLSAAPAAIAAATAATVAPADVRKEIIAAVAAAGVAAFKLLRSISRNVIELPPDEKQLIACLKMSRNSMDAPALYAHLIAAAPHQFPNDEAVERCLHRLTQKATRDGKIIALVTIDGLGVWRSAV